MEAVTIMVSAGGASLLTVTVTCYENRSKRLKNKCEQRTLKSQRWHWKEMQVLVGVGMVLTGGTEVDDEAEEPLVPDGEASW